MYLSKHLLNVSLYKYSSLLYLETANSGECDSQEREKAEWWGGGGFKLNANTIVTVDHLYKRARCVVRCASHMASLTGSGNRGRSPSSLQALGQIVNNYFSQVINIRDSIVTSKSQRFTSTNDQTVYTHRSW